MDAAAPVLQGTNRAVVEYTGPPGLGGRLTDWAVDVLDEAGGDKPAAFPYRRYSANTVTVSNGFEALGHTYEPTATATRGHYNSFKADDARSWELGHGGRVDRAVGGLDEALRGLDGLEPTHALPLPPGVYVPELENGETRVTLGGAGESGKLFRYMHGDARPQAIDDVVSAAAKLMRRV